VMRKQSKLMSPEAHLEPQASEQGKRRLRSNMKAGAYIKYTGVYYHRCKMECIIVSSCMYMSSGSRRQHLYDVSLYVIVCT
jgi:hypothetical protein